MKGKATAVVYVDALNLYRRRLSGQNQLKWLNLPQLLRQILPDYDVIAVEYFTAILKPSTVDDPQSLIRQQIYLRALSTEKTVRITYGTFRADVRIMQIHPKELEPETNEVRTVAVRKIEEKGSDVNLATRMVADALTGRCDVVVLLSNDSDHAGQVEMLINEFQIRVGLISPMLESKRSSKQLRSLNLEFSIDIAEIDLIQSQFPEILEDKNGTITRPAAWS